tara:strand:+ start:1168 stop:2688 length:1521 start_codon:yes stop_codon:yes gene_type:complete
MANPRQNITISAPAFKGLNTQDSPIDMDPSYAAIAENCVIDEFGRIGSRKGFKIKTADVSSLGGNSIEVIKEFINSTGTNVLISAGNNKIFSGTTSLTDVSPSSYTISANNWKMVNLNDHLFMFQSGHEPLVFAGSAVEKMSAHSGSSGTPPFANEVLSAYGRLFAANTTSNKTLVYWSDLLDGTAWTGGSSGSLDITKVWPSGSDEIIALAAHNGFLIIFGKQSIVVYAGATDPANMTLSDTVANVGCIERDSVQHTGTDLIFLSATGVRSFGRTIQEKSLPLTDVSKNVRNKLMDIHAEQSTPVRSVFSPEEAFYLLSLPDSNTVFCFDLRGTLEDGSYRVTMWSATELKAMDRLQDTTLYFGNTNGLLEYTGFQDYGGEYQLRYFSNPLAFGDSSRLKMLKEIIATVIGGQQETLTFNWAYDYSESFNKQATTIQSNANTAFFNESEFNVATSEFTGSILVSKVSTKTTGSGNVASIGFEAQINNNPLSLQEVNIQAILGRMN